jgi:hypothetical protein
MRQCVNVIEDYARVSPSSVGQSREVMAQAQANMNQFELSIDPALSGSHNHAEQESEADPTKAKDDKVKVKRVKKPKDPNAPTKPPSAYIIYQNNIRKKLKDEQPNLTYPEVLQEVSRKWKEISPEEKKVG